MRFPYYSAKAFNEMVEIVERGTPLSGHNMTARPTSAGVAYDYTGPRFTHPWELQPFFNPDTRTWCCYVIPGFVNGADPLIKMPNEWLPESPSVFGTKYGELGLSGIETEVLLTDDPQPYLILTEFNDPASVQSDSTGIKSGSYPKFFQAEGARQPDEPDPLLQAAISDTIAATLGIQREEATPTKENVLSDTTYGNRSIASCDVVLTVNRAAVSTGFQFVTLFNVPNALVLNTVSVTPPPPGYGARLRHTSKYFPVQEPSLEDRLSGDYQEPNFEEILIGTIWFLSPDPTLQVDSVGEFPNSSWTAYVENKVFWNLNFASENKIQAPVNSNLILITGLAGGVADPLFASLLAPINEANAIAQAAYNGSTMKGHFWTG